MTRQTDPARSTPEPASPWNRIDGWQINDAPYRAVSWTDHGKTRRVGVTWQGETTALVIDGLGVSARDVTFAASRLIATIDGLVFGATVVLDDAGATIFHGGKRRDLVRFDPIARAGARAEDIGALIAPMPGLVTAVFAAPATRVARGAVLMTIEAMKVEHAIRAPSDGLVTAIRYKIGDRVIEGDLLVDFTPDASAGP